LIPLSPYIVLGNAFRGLIVSAIVTLAALGIFGYIKGKFTGAKASRSAFQTVIIGGLAAAAAFLLAKLIA
jgi:VIT1/CCC1 family predicted Fe2+/Mn2+ transporter